MVSTRGPRNEFAADKAIPIPAVSQNTGIGRITMVCKRQQVAL